jgi:hypothetical protein
MVTVGPRLISTTWQGAPKEANVSSISRARLPMNSSVTLGACAGSRISATFGSTQDMAGLAGRLMRTVTPGGRVGF